MLTQSPFNSSYVPIHFYCHRFIYIFSTLRFGYTARNKYDVCNLRRIPCNWTYQFVKDNGY